MADVARSELPEPTAPLTLRVRLDDGEPPSGAVAVEGEAAEAQFQGWVELIAAIEAARKRPPASPRT